MAESLRPSTQLVHHWSSLHQHIASFAPTTTVFTTTYLNDVRRRQYIIIGFRWMKFIFTNGLLKHWTAVILNQRNADHGDDSFTTAIGRLGCRQRRKGTRLSATGCAAVAIPAVKPILVRVPRSFDKLFNVMPLTCNKVKRSKFDFNSNFGSISSTSPKTSTGQSRGRWIFQPPMHIRTLVDALWTKARVTK